MAESSAEETTPLVFNEDIPKTVRNTRRPYEKQLAIHHILVTIVPETTTVISLAYIIDETSCE